jgi:hypothetical protein
MVKIEIDDEVWNLYRKSWVLCGVRDHYKQVKMLEDQLWTESSEIIEDLQWEFEAYGQQEIGLKEEQREKNECKT